ncbi:MAG TPA: hypothetical protein PKW35_13775 [Nannocystaceae bacterium]|nr:hypothetical protein [Nannocystaceae bacterium]
MPVIESDIPEVGEVELDSLAEPFEVDVIADVVEAIVPVDPVDAAVSLVVSSPLQPTSATSSSGEIPYTRRVETRVNMPPILEEARGPGNKKMQVDSPISGMLVR